MLTHFGGIIKRVNEQIIEGDSVPYVVHFMPCLHLRCVARLTEMGYRFGGYPFRPTRGCGLPVATSAKQKHRPRREPRPWWLCAPPFRSACSSGPQGRPLRSAEAEGCIAVKVSHQNSSRRCEFRSYHAKSDQPCSHQELFVFGFALLRAYRFGFLCELVEGK